MKPNNKWFAFAGLALVALLFSAWQSTGSSLPVKPYVLSVDQDTLKPKSKSQLKKNYPAGEIDIEMKEMEKAMAEMNKEMKIDFSKMDKEIKQAMEEIKKIDFAKISQDVEASLKEINWDKTRMEVDKALKEAEIKIKAIDIKKLEKEMAKVSEEVSKQKIISQVDLEKIKKNVQESLAKAKLSIANSMKELSQLKEFTDSLEKEGLINKKKGYKIEIKDGELYINGNKQTKEVNDKYRKYFKEDNFSISSDSEDSIKI